MKKWKNNILKIVIPLSFFALPVLATCGALSLVHKQSIHKTQTILPGRKRKEIEVQEVIGKNAIVTINDVHSEHYIAKRGEKIYLKKGDQYQGEITVESISDKKVVINENISETGEQLKKVKRAIKTLGFIAFLNIQFIIIALFLPQFMRIYHFYRKLYQRESI